MRDDQLDYLDDVVADVLDGNYSRVGVLSTGERLYVALAASDIGLLREMGYTVAQALGRLDYGDADSLVRRWRSVERWAKQP
jgi:hypothetical protein